MGVCVVGGFVYVCAQARTRCVLWGIVPVSAVLTGQVKALDALKLESWAVVSP